eukprot:8350009-Pyramimonas_sp.AAC.1
MRCPSLSWARLGKLALLTIPLPSGVRSEALCRPCVYLLLGLDGTCHHGMRSSTISVTRSRSRLRRQLSWPTF